MRVDLDVGPPDKIGNHDVLASRNGEEYPGQFNVYDDRQRIRWSKMVGAKFGLSAEEWGQIPDRLVARANAEEERLEQSRRKPIEKFSVGELVEKFPKLNPPIIDGLFREGETCNIVAGSKVGKSWLVYCLALNIIMGWKLFGKFQCTPGNVLLVDNELHPATLANRIPKVGAAMELFPADYGDNLEVWPLRGNLRTLAELGIEFEKIPHGEKKVVICDARYRFQPPRTSENDNSAATEIYNLIERYAEQMGAAFVLIHHSSKGGQSDKRVTDVGAGAGSQSRAADAHVVLREHEDENVAVLDAAVRSFAPVKPMALRWEFPLWTYDEFADTALLKGSKTRGEERQMERDKGGFEKIFKAIGDDRMTARKIRDATGISRDRAERLLGLLVADEHLVFDEIKVKGKLCREYRIPQ